MNADLLISVVPQTAEWSAKTASVMILSNLACISAGRYIIQAKGQGPALPGPVSALGINLPELIATTSLGHIIGAGAILGLGYLGILA
jgi:photosystem I subunit 10|tara:strand:- start:426 stop:689 length:264 start_codon:yes stop_codon:yes gene_type:complete